jgi:tripartite-type tricarboxylate transporter receptor subunit TctC
MVNRNRSGQQAARRCGPALAFTRRRRLITIGRNNNVGGELVITPAFHRATLGSLAFAALAALPCIAAAQQYPARPVRIVVPSVAGGGTDSTTRIVAAKMEEFLKQSVVVDDKPGAASIIGSDLVAHSPPDGYTLLAAISTITIQPSMQKKLPFDPLKDFAPVSQFIELPNMLVGHPSLKPKTVKELIAFAHANPGKLEFASAGTGSNLHLCMELFLYMAKAKMVHVPYKGASQAIADVVAGYVPLMVTNMMTGVQQMRAGRLHAYGVTSAKRSDAAPDSPTIAEAGVPGYEAVQWYGLMAPAGTPQPIVDKLYQAVTYALRDPGVQQKFHASGARPVGSTPAEYAKRLRADIAKWAALIKEAGIKAD